MNSRDRWNAKYKQRNNDPASLPQVPAYLQRHWQQLPQGEVLDLACGDGAAALFLAAMGYQVTAVDIAEEGLARLSSLAGKANLSVETKQLDLEQPSALASYQQRFSAIVICRYKPDKLLWQQLPTLLQQGGILLLASFNQTHHQKTGFPERFCLKPEEYISAESDLKLLDYSVLDEMDGYIFQR